MSRMRRKKWRSSWTINGMHFSKHGTKKFSELLLLRGSPPLRINSTLRETGETSHEGGS